MSSVSSLGIGLSVVFACFLLSVMFFCWKKRFNNPSSPSSSSSSQHMMNDREVEEGEKGSSGQVFYFLCWKKHLQQGSTKNSTALSANSPDHANDRTVMKGAKRQEEEEEEQLVLSPESPVEDVEDFISRLFPLQREGLMGPSEVMTIEGLLRPPRFLFTIKEETKEDMESEDSKSSKGGRSHKGRHGRSLSDPFAQMRMVDIAVETPPFLTPSSSPPFYTPLETPPWTPLHPSPSNSPLSRCLESPKPCDKAGNYTPLMEMCNGSLSSSPQCNSGDENASYITIFVKR